MNSYMNMDECTLDGNGRVFYQGTLLCDHLLKYFTKQELYDWAKNGGLPVCKSWPKRHIITYIVDSFYSYLNK